MRANCFVKPLNRGPRPAFRGFPGISSRIEPLRLMRLTGPDPSPQTGA